MYFPVHLNFKLTQKDAKIREKNIKKFTAFFVLYRLGLENGPMLSNMRNDGEPESTYRIIDTGLLAEITNSELGLF